ncbi:MAG: WYL domain-containing protein [Clostridiales bacterium]|nr:WYL domain-containing protein [Clostridiales bacterium]
MGFFFNGEDLDKKQHINLSESAWCVIEQDIKNFYLDEKAESKSGFLNTVIANFYELAEASISLRCKNKEEELRRLLSGDNKGSDMDESLSRVVSSICKAYMDELINKTYSYPKGHGEKFRINQGNVNLLRDDVHEEKYYDDNVGQYLKALYEEYCLLQTFERERVFFKKNFDEINKAISEQKKLKITIKQKHNPIANTTYNRKFYVTPYKIVQDTTKSYNYLVGLAEEILPDNTLTEKKISSFRISRIDKVMVCTTMSGRLSQEKKDCIEKELREKTPQFMAGDLIDVKIRFTKKGYENYNRLLYLRPNNYTKVDGEDLTYVFHCTEMQCMSYFLKFVRDAEILEPLYLRNKFKDRYKNALEVYETE